MKEPLFMGAATAVVTPFCGGEIDFEAYDRILDRQIAAKIPAIVVTGTTGEASTLTAEEKCSLWRRSVQYAAGKAKIIAGVGTNCTASSVELTALAASCQVDGLLAVTPYYNKCTQEGLIRHYHAIAEASSLPLIIYDVPARTGVHILPQTCAELSHHPRINGIKYAGGDVSAAAEILQCCGNDFHLWCGNDDQCVATMSLGGVGLISVLSNLLPAEIKEMCDLCLLGGYTAAAELQLYYLPLIRALFAQPNPIPVKTAMALLGLCREEVRLPLTPLGTTEAQKLYHILQALKIA